MTQWETLLESLQAARGAYAGVYIGFLRYFAPIAAGLLLAGEVVRDLAGFSRS